MKPTFYDKINFVIKKKLRIFFLNFTYGIVSDFSLTKLSGRNPCLPRSSAKAHKGSFANILIFFSQRYITQIKCFTLGTKEIILIKSPYSKLNSLSSGLPLNDETAVTSESLKNSLNC